MSAACQHDGARGRRGRRGGEIPRWRSRARPPKGRARGHVDLQRVPALGGRISRSVVGEIVKRVRPPS